MTVVVSTLNSVRQLAPAIRALIDDIEQERRLPVPVVHGLVDAGVFRMLKPRSLSGDELEPMTVCQVIEEVAIHDGALAWCTMLGAANGYFGGILDGDRPRLTPSGSPVMKLMFLRRAQASVIDTWYAVGLRGTGSQTLKSTTSSSPRLALCGLPTRQRSVRRRTTSRPLLCSFRSVIRAKVIGDL